MTKAIDAFSKYFLYLTCRVSWSVCLSAWPGGCGVTMPQYCCLSGPAALSYGSPLSHTSVTRACEGGRDTALRGGHVRAAGGGRRELES